MNSTQIICILAGLAAGFLVAYINMLISKRGYQTRTTTTGIMGASAMRFVLNLVAIAAGYFICKNTGLPLFETLIGIAIGLSVGGILFLKVLINEMQKNANKQNDGKQKSNEERSE